MYECEMRAGIFGQWYSQLYVTRCWFRRWKPLRVVLVEVSYYYPSIDRLSEISGASLNGEMRAEELRFYWQFYWFRGETRRFSQSRLFALTRSIHFYSRVCRPTPFMVYGKFYFSWRKKSREFPSRRACFSACVRCDAKGREREVSFVTSVLFSYTRVSVAISKVHLYC